MTDVVVDYNVYSINHSLNSNGKRLFVRIDTARRSMLPLLTVCTSKRHNSTVAKQEQWMEMLEYTSDTSSRFGSVHIEAYANCLELD